MKPRPRSLLLIATLAVGVVTLTGVAHATPAAPAVAARTPTATKAATPAHTTTTAAAKPAAARPRLAVTTKTTRFRIQAGAARTQPGASSLAKNDSRVRPAAGFFVVGSGTTYRVVSACHTRADALSIKAALAAKGITSLVYPSVTC